MVITILTIPAFILFVILFFTYKSISNYKNALLFAVTLPPNAIEHPELQAIKRAYDQTFKRIFIGQVVAYLPLLFMNKWTGLQIIYYLLWILTAAIIVVLPYRRAFRATLELKRQEEWFVGEKRVIHADLRAAQLKNQRSLSPKLFLIPISLSVLLIFWASSSDTQLYSIGIGALLTSLMMLGVVVLLRRSKAIIYSDNSDSNVALNQFRRRTLSFLFFWLAILENVHFYLIALLLLNENEQMANVWLVITIGFSIIPALLIVVAYQRITTMRREMLTLEDNPIYSDDDEYWANGFTYHNPYDKTVLVPKRVGIGETINTGTLIGKLVVGGALGLLIVVVAGVSFMLIRSELTSPALTVTDHAEIAIDYPMYSYTFQLEDIEELLLVDSIPSGTKTNGEATSKYSRGHFRLKELGQSRLYVFRDNAPYIRFKLEDQYIFYNDADANETQRLYDQLHTMLGMNNR